MRNLIAAVVAALIAAPLLSLPPPGVLAGELALENLSLNDCVIADSQTANMGHDENRYREGRAGPVEAPGAPFPARASPSTIGL